MRLWFVGLLKVVVIVGLSMSLLVRPLGGILILLTCNSSKIIYYFPLEFHYQKSVDKL